MNIEKKDRFGQVIPKKEFAEAKAQPLEIPDDAVVEVGNDRARRSLAPDPDKGTYDPFEKYKTDPDKYFYYAVNGKAALLREERVRQGFELIPEAVHGDLVLGRMPIEQHKKMIAKEEEKSKAQLRAPKEQYIEEARRLGVPVEEE